MKKEFLWEKNCGNIEKVFFNRKNWINMENFLFVVNNSL